MAVETLPQNGDAIRAVERLAKEAAGGLIAAEIKPPAGAVGLPEAVPVLFKAGANPELVSVAGELAKWRTAPECRQGQAVVTTLSSFIALAVRHKDAHSAIFARTLWPDPALTAVIDYHQTDGAARYGKHRVHYAFPLTEEFKRWVASENKPMSQKEFAEFIEDNIMDLSVAMEAEAKTYEDQFRTKFAVPTDLIALSRGLEVNVGASIKNQVRLQSGEMSVRFDTTHTGADGQPLVIPGLFMLSLRAFIDGSEVRIPARLRYRPKDGGVVWFYQLYKWQDALRDRVVADAAVAQQQTGLPLYEGAPEA